MTNEPYGAIYAAVERHRAALLRMERAAASEMVRAYGPAWRRMRARISKLVREYQAVSTPLGVAGATATSALAANTPVSPAWVHEYNRLNDLMAQVEGELRKLHGAAYRSTVRSERAAIEASTRDMRELISIVGDPGISAQFNRVPVAALRDMVGTLRNGTPLRGLLDALGVEASGKIREELLTGLAMGEGPRAVARRIRGALGGDLARALRISRTEALRAYRTATNEQYKANDQIINGWRWLSAKGPRTCAACLALDGTWHPSSEVQTDHPSGRCSSIVSLRNRDDPSQPAPWQTGSQWLAEQSPEVQQQVLGKSGAAAYQAGAVTLEDFRGDGYSPVWGHTPRVRSLAQVVGPEEAARWADVAAGRDESGQAGEGSSLLGIEYLPDESVMARIRARRLSEAGDIFHDATGQRLTQEQIRKRVGDYVSGTRALEQPLCIRSTPVDAVKILESGRFKSQFEIGTSGGTLSDNMRRKAEHIGLGAPLDLPAERRPIYGYLDTSEIGHPQRVHGYGSVKWVLKNEVRDTRTTVTWGDSLGQFYEPRGVGAPTRGFSSEPAAWNTTFLEACAGKEDPGDWGIPYIEAQIQGQVALEAIDHVEWTVDTWYGWMPDDSSSGPDAVVARALQGYGLPGRELYERLISAGIRVIVRR